MPPLRPPPKDQPKGTPNTRPDGTIWGDSMSDLFTPNTFRTGAAELETRATAADPLRFEMEAYDEALRDLQGQLPGPSWARQYPIYLRPIRHVERPIQLVLEDRTHRRPVAIDPDLELPADTPIDAEAFAFIDAFVAKLDVFQT